MKVSGRLYMVHILGLAITRFIMCLELLYYCIKIMLIMNQIGFSYLFEVKGIKYRRKFKESIDGIISEDYFC